MNYIVILIIVVAMVYYFARNTNNKKLAIENVTAGENFLAKNKTSEGVQETPSGLQYLVLQKGSGETHPSAKSTVNVHYHGVLLDGTVFDSSVDRGTPISFPLNQVIAGWTEGLQLMVEGDKFKFFIPSNLAYGTGAVGNIPPGSLLVFDVELLEIQ